MYFVYILKCSDKSLYTGITNNLDKRLNEHATGKGSKYVRSKRPFKLVYTEKVKTKSKALKREYFIKSLSRLDKLKMVG